MSTVASELTRQLEAYGVSCVFGIPGVHTLELYRGLQETGIRHITPRHEQGAGFMADGYARASGKPGVCFIISGPGMTNIVTAMGQAYSESIPMLVISSVNAHGRMGSGDGWLHELPDQRSLVNGVCAFSHTVHDPCELPQVLARAFAVFDSQRPRPVHIELPINVLGAECVPIHHDVPKPPRSCPPTGNTAQLAQAAEHLMAASNPVMLIGGGARQAGKPVHDIAQKLDAPVVMTVNARGILAHDHPLAISASASLECVRTLIEQADVVLAIGTEFGPTDYDAYEDGQFKINGTLIRIDLDAQQLVRNQMPQIGIVGDAHSSCIEQIKPLSLETLHKLSTLATAHLECTHPHPISTLQWVLAHWAMPFGVNLLVPDLYAMASSCAWNCVELDRLANFSTLLQNAQHNTTPTLIILNDCLFNSCGE